MGLFQMRILPWLLMCALASCSDDDWPSSLSWNRSIMLLGGMKVEKLKVWELSPADPLEGKEEKPVRSDIYCSGSLRSPTTLLPRPSMALQALCQWRGTDYYSESAIDAFMAGRFDTPPAVRGDAHDVPFSTESNTPWMLADYVITLSKAEDKADSWKKVKAEAQLDVMLCTDSNCTVLVDIQSVLHDMGLMPADKYAQWSLALVYSGAQANEGTGSAKTIQPMTIESRSSLMNEWAALELKRATSTIKYSWTQQHAYVADDDGDRLSVKEVHWKLPGALWLGGLGERSPLDIAAAPRLQCFRALSSIKNPFIAPLDISEAGPGRHVFLLWPLLIRAGRTPESLKPQSSCKDADRQALNFTCPYFEDGVLAVVQAASRMADQQAITELATTDSTKTTKGALLDLSITIVAIVAMASGRSDMEDWVYVALSRLMSIVMIRTPGNASAKSNVWLVRVSRVFTCLIVGLGLVMAPLFTLLSETTTRFYDDRGSSSKWGWVASEAEFPFIVVGVVTVKVTTVYDQVALVLEFVNVTLSCLAATMILQICYGHALLGAGVVCCAKQQWCAALPTVFCR